MNSLQLEIEAGQTILAAVGNVSHDLHVFAKQTLAHPSLKKKLGSAIRDVHGSDDLINGAVADAVLAMHFFGQWAAFGYNVFDLTHGLAAGLLLTEPPPYSPDEFEVPFPAFRVRIPPGTVPVWMAANSEPLWATEIWVDRYAARVRVDGELREWIQIIVRTKGYADVTMSRTIEDLYDRQSNDPGVTYRYRPDDPPALPEDDITRGTALHVLRNFVSWLTATGGMATRTPQSRPPSASEMGPRPNVWVVGKEVKLSREMRQTATDVALGCANQRAGWKVRVRYVVRGHWRNQACGQGRGERRKQWIAPFWKGPQDGEQWSHLYKA